jgi:tartrate dehydrogenase/decarboxylase/D-malate dehydrogenase
MDAARTAMAAIESVTADASLHTRDLGRQATTAQMTAALCGRIQSNPVARRAA